MIVAFMNYPAPYCLFCSLLTQNNFPAGLSPQVRFMMFGLDVEFVILDRNNAPFLPGIVVYSDIDFSLRVAPDQSVVIRDDVTVRLDLRLQFLDDRCLCEFFLFFFLPFVYTDLIRNHIILP